MPIKTRIDMLATGIKTPVGIKMAGPDLEEIERIGRDVERAVLTVEGTTSVYSERVAGGRYVDVDIDRERASRFGLNIADVQDVVRSAVGGMNVTQTVEGLERYPVNVRYPQRVRDSVQQLRAVADRHAAGRAHRAGRRCRRQRRRWTAGDQERERAPEWLDLRRYRRPGSWVLCRRGAA